MFSPPLISGDETGTLWSPVGAGLVLSTVQSGSATPAASVPVSPIRAKAAPAVEAAVERVPRVTVCVTPVGSVTLTWGRVNAVDDAPVCGVGVGAPLALTANATRPPASPMDTTRRRIAWLPIVTRPRTCQPLLK